MTPVGREVLLLLLLLLQKMQLLLLLMRMMLWLMVMLKVLGSVQMGVQIERILPRVRLEDGRFADGLQGRIAGLNARLYPLARVRQRWQNLRLLCDLVAVLP